MRKFTKILMVTLALFVCQIAIQAQNTGSISGTVVDQQGAVVPGATVTVTGQSGQEFTTTTNSEGLYRIPAVAAGTFTYTVTITAPSFKTAVIQNVKVDIGTPSTVNAVLQAGQISEQVVVTSGAEVLQTETAKVGTTITGRQIIETPIASRDALDLVLLLPGAAQAGRPRASSINGLPKGAINISLDGVDAQDNANRSTDGFFTYIRPRVDAIDEVTVSTSNPGAESGGDGAVQIRFVTRRGTNDYTGGLFWQHRNTALNSNYWYNNRDRLPRQKIILNQYGGHFGGNIPFLGFGEGVKAFDSGKDKRFFFINYEEYRNPESTTRTRTVLAPNAYNGIYSYVVGGVTQTLDVFALATANPGQTNTPDPTVQAALARIRTATATTGTFTPITNNPTRLNYNFTNSGLSLRNFLAFRTDFNITKKHSLEFVYNRNNFKPGKDFLNSRDEIFPGFPFQGQSGVRQSFTGALRSTFGNNIVNEARYATSWGTTDFFSELNTSVFDFTGGRFLDIGTAAAITNPYNGNSSQTRGTPTYDLTDSVTWVNGNHTFNFGGQYKYIKTDQTNVNRIVPTVGFGIDSSEGTAFTMFNGTSMPGSTTAQQADARAFYAGLIGRVISYTSAAYLDGSGLYKENGPLTQQFGLRTFGIFAQDSWRVRSGLTVTFGVRWQPQEAFTAKTGNIGRLENWEQVFGPSGKAGIFQPGATGSIGDPRVVLYKIGEKAYKDDMNNVSPSVGVVWSPNFAKGLLSKVFGESGRSVFRGGYNRSFVREGSATQTIVTNNTPGGSIPLSRNTGIAGSFTVGTNLRTPGNTNVTTPTFSSTPAFPLTLTTASQAISVDPNLKTGYVDSFSFGYQREIDRNTVVEVRYVGNRGKNLHRLNFTNEVNTIENGFGAEFRLAQQNLYQNILNGFASSGFAYRGPGTNTSPLPIMLSYFTNFGSAANLAAASLVAANYTAANFNNATLVAALSINAPSLANFIGSTSFENSAARRNNAIANGRPANFFRTAPTVPAGSFLLQSDARSWYDSAVVEVRRRLSAGLRLQASYVFSKAQSDAAGSAGGGQSNYTLRPGGLALAKNYQPFDLRHQFKLDATYDLPFGKGRQFLGNASGVVDGLVGGWSIMPIVRWQSGTPISFGNVQLVGMTARELEKSIKVNKGPNVVTYLPADIILNTQRAFDISVLGAGGYGTTYGGAPTGRFIAPAGYGNCQSQFSGNCGFQNLIVHGPSYRTFDLGVAKRVGLGEKRSVELRATFLDLLNNPSFRVGGWAADVATVGVGGTTFGQLGAGSAYQDLSTTNNPGGRIVDLMLRFNF
ncbi:MAG: TonB-dependent receptor [Pyrinomonadaceae bacterium]